MRRCAKKITRTMLKTSLLMVGEGPTEKIFLQHLKTLFWCMNCDHNVKIDNAHGGSPADIVQRANILLSQRAYSKCAIVLDTDVPWEEPELLRKIRRNNTSVAISAIGSIPCIEGLMLEILDGKCLRTSNECKRLFHNKYIPEKLMRRANKYAVIFPENIIVEACNRIESLNNIVTFLKNELVDENEAD